MLELRRHTVCSTTFRVIFQGANMFESALLAVGTGWSLGGAGLYLLGGGGFIGAVIIFFVLRMIGGRTR
jgi:hypothetical protein